MFVTKGSETEVTRDFVFEPPQATIGLQYSAFLPSVGGHCCTALAVFYESDLTYITFLLILNKFVAKSPYCEKVSRVLRVIFKFIAEVTDMNVNDL